MAEREYVLAGGCFWCLDAAFRALRGVTEVVSGYAGGTVADPNYEAVCKGETGHAEAVLVRFDDEVIPAEVILDAFFTMHDPRQLNRQGNDVGTQYRSAMFVADQQQREEFTAALQRAAEIWDGDPVTTLEDLTEFHPAEEYHQNFFAKNPEQGYCLAVAVPKVNKVRAAFSQYLK
ncbi:peptide-methionine (S)-S-oxide reductase [Leucobacter sp. OH2974_COT-288]|nr:peptide-methionine (S)-S-oxide reductase [Leucobacter sp. OH2974_COT-288]